ncbi:hypothetical protein TRAPUB_6507 [Trametes pubescens]|uniref:Uncharacterized protein n=1 Tax=Trametes pubescens TaxID=154538 RepID=A0A1M2V5R7_TRAPU|nr:hypothetical protein TRAPUB_6507 [Trametes pubescens]
MGAERRLGHARLPACGGRQVRRVPGDDGRLEYIRRELVRLERIPDEVFLRQGVIGTESYGLELFRFGSVRRADRLVAVSAQSAITHTFIYYAQ